MRLLTATVFTVLLSAPAFAADLGTYRPGTPYNSAVAAGADVCDSQCAGDAQCRGWNYVKPNPRAAGVCEFLSSVSAPIASQISISGESLSAMPLSSRVTAGGTNTVRVGTTVTPKANTVRVGQSPTGRRIVRQAVPQRAAPQTAATKPIANMSLTAQQNRYRQGQTQSQTQGQSQGQAPQPQPRQMFRPILDGAMPQRQQPRPPQMQRPQVQQQMPQQTRRITGPRRAPVQQNLPAQGQPYPPQAAVQMPPRVPQMQPQNMVRRSVAAPQMQAPQTVANPVAVAPKAAARSLFGRLHDDVKSPEATPTDMPIATAVPTQPVTRQQIPALAGGL